MPIAIVGTGIAGTEIAHAVALAGDEMLLHDTNERALRLALGQISRQIDHAVVRGKLDAFHARRIKHAFTLSTDLQTCASASLVIEAVPDTLAAKQAVLQALDRLIPPHAILATTTHSLSITRLAASTRHPERVIGLHFCRPAHIIRVVEVVRGLNAAPDRIEQAAAFVRSMGKTPVVLDDTPGLVVSRLVQAYFGEALHLLDQNALDEETIDKLMQATGFPMGPFRLMDYLGIDQVLDVTRAMVEATFHAAPYRPHPRQQRLVEAGRLGHKSPLGGFYPPAKK